MPVPRAVLIVGGGLAGLATAALLRAQNIPTLVLESAERVGGRSIPHEESGFRWDALVALSREKGALTSAISEMGLPAPEGKPLALRLVTERAAKLETGSLGFVMRTKIGGFGMRLGARGLLSDSLHKKEDRLDHWYAIKDPGSALDVMNAFAGPDGAEMRTTPTTAFALARETVLERRPLVALAGGCRAMVQQLLTKAGDVRTGAAVERLVLDGGFARGVKLRSGEFVECAGVVLAIPPTQIRSLLEEPDWMRVASEERARIDACAPRAALDAAAELSEPLQEGFFAFCDEPPAFVVGISAIDPTTAPSGRGLVLARIGLPHHSVERPWDLSDARRQELESQFRSAIAKLLSPKAAESAQIRSRLRELDDPAAALCGGRTRPASTFSAFENVFLVGDGTDTPGLPLERAFGSARAVAKLAASICRSHLT